MGDCNRKNRLLPAFLLVIAALWWGGRLKRGLISHLGGQYSIMTEFTSDWASIAFYKFSQFRNTGLLLTVLAILVLVLLYKYTKSRKKAFIAAMLLYISGCVVSALILQTPGEIILFIIGRACCFALDIIAAVLVLPQ